MQRQSFRYRALAVSGAVESGTFVGDSERDAREMLAGRGLLALTLRARPLREVPRAALPWRDLGLGLRILADLLEAGLPVARALAAFEELAPKSWRVAVPALRNSVKEGRSLAGALAEAPIDIPPLVVGIARAGEAGTGAPAAIRRAAEITEATAAMRASVRAALMYPMILALAGAGSIAVLIGVVLPRFAAILADLGQALPASTRLVIQISLMARRTFLPGFVALVILVLSLRMWINTERGRMTWHRLLLRLPLLGTIRAASTTARTVASLATLLESGVPLRQALNYAGRASGDAAVEHGVLAAGAQIASGKSIALALGGSGAITSVAVRLIRAGEQSGRLTAMLAHAAKLEQERADRLTQTFVRLLEPTLILIFAGIVAFVAAALLQAVYSVRPAG